MEITDTDFKNGFISTFQYAVKSGSYFYHVTFLESCMSFNLCPAGLCIKKDPFIKFESDDLNVMWKNVIMTTQEQLLDMLCIGNSNRLFKVTESFWKEIDNLEKEEKCDALKGWLVKMVIHIEKRQKKIIKVKCKKLCKLTKDNKQLQTLALSRFSEQVDYFTFRDDFIEYGQNLSPDIMNLVTLVTLGLPFHNEEEGVSDQFLKVFVKTIFMQKGVGGGGGISGFRNFW